jgi:sugar phosphate isomerase/epimerase
MTDFSYQLYSSRNFPPLPETLKMLGELGYRQVEGYGGLFADPDAIEELKGHLAANGLTMPTGHIGLDMVRDQPERVLEIAKALGMEAIFVPAIGRRSVTRMPPGGGHSGSSLQRLRNPTGKRG